MSKKRERKEFSNKRKQQNEQIFLQSQPFLIHSMYMILRLPTNERKRKEKNNRQRKKENNDVGFFG
jgi:hypothetical protein